jgi:hypothetical protein
MEDEFYFRRIHRRSEHADRQRIEQNHSNGDPFGS